MGAGTLEQTRLKKLLLQSISINGRWSTREEAAGKSMGSVFPAFCYNVEPSSLIYLVILPPPVVAPAGPARQAELEASHCTPKRPQVL
jgi:hypothetical protein